MKIETPMMAVRRLTGLSSTYMDAIYESFVTMRGSGDVLNPDFNEKIIGLTNYTRTNRMTLTGDSTSASSAAASTAAWSAIGDTDLLLVSVGKVAGTSGTAFGIGGGGTNNIKTANLSAGANYTAQFRDAASTDFVDENRSDTITEPTDGDVMMMVGVREKGVNCYSYGHNFTSGSDAYESQLDSGTPTTAGLTPLADNMALLDWNDFYGGMVFEFTAGSLPSTWKADMLAMAQSLIAAKS